MSARTWLAALLQNTYEIFPAVVEEAEEAKEWDAFCRGSGGARVAAQRACAWRGLPQ